MKEPSIYARIAEIEAKRQSAVLCTVVSSRGSTPRHHGSKMLVLADGSITGTVGGGEIENRVKKEAADALKDGKSRLVSYSLVDPKKGDAGVCGGTVEVYIDPILPSPTLLVIGGGHVGKAVVHLGKWLGFYVVVSDDRPEFCGAEMNPDADETLCCEMSELPAKIEIGANTFIVITTRGGELDQVGMPALLENTPAYLGVIGSKKRWIYTKNVLIEKGVSQEKLEKVFSPIGLELNAETPEEIAVSILSQIIMLKNDGTGQSMKLS